MAWVKNGTPKTLTSDGDTLTISDLTALIFNQFMAHLIDNGSAIDVDFRIDNFELSSGIYFYQLRAGSFIETKKMILLK